MRNKIKVVPNLLYSNYEYKEPSIDQSVISMMEGMSQKNFTPLLDQCLNIEFEFKFKKLELQVMENTEDYSKQNIKLISLGILELLGNIKNTENFLIPLHFYFPSLWEGYPNS